MFLLLFLLLLLLLCLLTRLVSLLRLLLFLLRFLLASLLLRRLLRAGLDGRGLTLRCGLGPALGGRLRGGLILRLSRARLRLGRRMVLLCRRSVGGRWIGRGLSLGMAGND